LRWASHHPCAKWKGIFKANSSHLQAQSQGFFVLPLAQKQKVQQSAKRWAKIIWLPLELIPNKQTVLGWSLEQE
jgi:hypothetical protein